MVNQFAAGDRLETISWKKISPGPLPGKKVWRCHCQQTTRCVPVTSHFKWFAPFHRVHAVRLVLQVQLVSAVSQDPKDPLVHAVMTAETELM